MTAGTDRDFTGAVMPGVADLDGAVAGAGTAGEAAAIARGISASVGVSGVVLQFKGAGPGSVAALLEQAAGVPAVARTWAAVVEVVRVQGAVEVVVAVEAAAIIIETTREPGIAGLFFRRQDDYGLRSPRFGHPHYSERGGRYRHQLDLWNSGRTRSWCARRR